MQTKVATVEYLGNSQIPEAGEDYYTYAGEIPWSTWYTGAFRLASGRARRHLSPVLYRFEGGKWREFTSTHVVYRFGV